MLSAMKLRFSSIYNGLLNSTKHHFSTSTTYFGRSRVGFQLQLHEQMTKDNINAENRDVIQPENIPPKETNVADGWQWKTLKGYINNVLPQQKTTTGSSKSYLSAKSVKSSERASRGYTLPNPMRPGMKHVTPFKPKRSVSILIKYVSR